MVFYIPSNCDIKVQMHAACWFNNRLLYGFVSVRAIIQSLKLVDRRTNQTITCSSHACTFRWLTIPTNAEKNIIRYIPCISTANIITTFIFEVNNRDKCIKHKNCAILHRIHILYNHVSVFIIKIEQSQAPVLHYA